MYPSTPQCIPFLSYPYLTFLPVENNDITAFKAGGCSKATCKPLNPPHDFPYIPTDPLLQG